jgi:hypothetical protein
MMDPHPRRKNSNFKLGLGSGLGLGSEIRVYFEPPSENGGSNGGSTFPYHLIGVKKVRFDFSIGGSRNFGGLRG